MSAPVRLRQGRFQFEARLDYMSQKKRKRTKLRKSLGPKPKYVDKARTWLELRLSVCRAYVKTQVQFSVLYKLGVVEDACSSNIQEVDLGKLGVQVHFLGSNTGCQAWWQSPLLEGHMFFFSFVWMKINFYE